MKLNAETSSLVNHIMSSNGTRPEVVNVSKDGKEVVLQRYSPRRVDDRGMTDAQDYIYDTLIESYLTLRLRYGKWYVKHEGNTDEKPTYDKVNVIFGERSEYYDYSF